MALFKSEEEKQKEEEAQIKKEENHILENKQYKGKVGATHTGWNFSDGLRNADKIKFKPTKFKIYDDKLLIERNKMIIEFSNIKEIFQENDSAKEAIIILNNDTGVPIKYDNGITESGRLKFQAFINILHNLIEENKSNFGTSELSVSNTIKSEDKFDKLIKLGDMHDKGLLSDEEFASLKQELLSGNIEEPTTNLENDVETSENICGNCGAEVEEDSNFCAECGTQIN